MPCPLRRLIDRIRRRHPLRTHADAQTPPNPGLTTGERPTVQTPQSFPALEQRHIGDARLFAHRVEMLRTLSLPADAVIGEVGVAEGGFSQFLLDQFKPKTFVGFDLFELHQMPILWGKPTSEVFEGKTHFAYYRDRFAHAAAEIIVEQGPSYDRLAHYPDGTFDMLYIDAGHEYKDVKKDTEIAAKKLKSNGVLIFNDYILYDHLAGTPYGVVQAVNELIVQGDWQIVGFALQQQMFCDIALRRASGQG